MNTVQGFSSPVFVVASGAQQGRVAMSNLFRSFKASLILIAITAILQGLAACKPQETTLPFETIDKALSSGRGSDSRGKDPSLIVITTADEVGELGAKVSFTAETQIRELDYTQCSVIAVFQGVKPSSGYGVEVEKITQAGSTIIVYAHFTERDPKQFAQDVETSPYHVVWIQKLQLHGPVEFVVNAGGNVVARQSRLMP